MEKPGESDDYDIPEDTELVHPELQESDETTPLIKGEQDGGNVAQSPPVNMNSSKARRVLRTCVLEIAVVFYYMALMSFFPIVQQYIYSRTLREQLESGMSDIVNNNDTSSCGGNGSSGAEGAAQQLSAQWLLFFGLATNIPGILSTMILGAFTDFRGRKVGMIVPATGSLIRTVISVFVIAFDGPFVLFIIGGFIDGCCGSFGTVFMASFAYLADITQPGKERTMRITILQAAIGVCGSAGLLGTGFLIQATGYVFPVFFGLGLLLLNILMVWCLLPETIKTRTDVRILDWNRIGNAFTCYFRPRGEGKRWKLLFLLAALFMVDMVQIGKAQIDTLFQLGTPFCWNAVKIGLYSAIGVFVQTFSMMALLRPLQKCMSDTVVGIIGSMSGMGQLILTGLAINDVMLYIAPLIGFLFGLPSAMLKAVMSTLVGREEQGSLFAGICSIQMLCSTVGSVMFNAVYIATVTSFAGLVFILMAGLFFICVVCMSVVEIFGKRPKTQMSESEVVPDC